MKLEKWALMAEIGSAIAVVISLIFVGIQVRTGAEETAVNTAVVRSAAFQELQAQIANLNVLLIENPQLDSANYRVVDLDQEPESESQARLVRTWLRLVVRHGEIAYKQYESDLLNETELRSVLAVVNGNIQNRFARDFWAFFSQRLDPGYVQYVNEAFIDSNG